MTVYRASAAWRRGQEAAVEARQVAISTLAGEQRRLRRRARLGDLEAGGQVELAAIGHRLARLRRIERAESSSRAAA